VPSEANNNHRQKLVDNLFDTQATYWRDTYRERDIQGIIYQRRQSVALRYIDELSLSKKSRVLEIGCGAGYMTVALAKRGFTVEAIDHSQAMVDLTTELARKTGTENLIKVFKADTHELSRKGKSFDLLVALGVIPWLHDQEKALSEMARILAPNGFAILTMDNALRATILLDPKTFPAVSQFHRLIKDKLEKANVLTSYNPWKNAPPYRQNTPKQFRSSLNKSGFMILKSDSVGFGPFTFFGHRLFSESLGIKIQERLQEYSFRGLPILRSAGSQYIILATKRLKNKALA